MNISAGLTHLIVGLAGIGAFTALAVTNTIDGATAVAGISGITGVLLGTSAVSVGSSNATVSASAATANTQQQQQPIGGLR